MIHQTCWDPKEQAKSLEETSGQIKGFLSYLVLENLIFQD